jgi:uncharacterized membrane protein
MDTLVLGLCIFFAVHLLPSFTSLHAALKNKLGEKAFKGMFALISLTGLWLIIFGMGEVEFTPLYEPPSWGKHVTSLLMLIALYCLISSEAKTSIRMITAHPMLWGISAWATGHLLANGDQASVILFGSFLTYSLFAMYSANRRGAQPNGEALALKTDGLVLVAAALVCIGLMFFHDSFTGMPIMG